MNRRHLLAGLAATASAAAVRSPARAQALETVTASKFKLVSDAPLMIADAKGYFRDAGIRVNWTTFPSSEQVIAPLATGQLDAAGASCNAGLFNAIGRGSGVKIVSCRGESTPGHGSLPLVVRTDLITSGRFKKLSDLRGMTIAEPGKGSSNKVILQKFLERGGVPYDAVKPVYLGFAAQVAAFKNRSIDASCLIEPYATLAEREGLVHKIMGDDVVFPNDEISVLLFSKNFMEQRPKVAQRFAVAYVRALRYYHDALKGPHFAGPTADDVLTILQDNLKLPDPSVLREMTTPSVNPDGYVSVKMLQILYDYYQREGLIENPTSVPAAVDLAFVEAAYKELGPYRPRTA
jgi:NitT/TauT family transport system substrate-binding protein